MLDKHLLLRGVRSLMEDFIRAKKIKPPVEALQPGTLVRYLPDDSFGLITSICAKHRYSHAYVPFILGPDGMAGHLIEDLGSVIWSKPEKFEKLCEPDAQTLALLSWYAESEIEENPIAGAAHAMGCGENELNGELNDEDASGDKTFEAPVILKLYYKPLNEGSDGDCFMTRAGFPSKEKATQFVTEWERVGNSVAWVQC